MSVRQLTERPTVLAGTEYVPGTAGEYLWFAFEHGDEPYAYAGLWPQGGEAWMLWRIVRRDVACWRDLKAVAVPEMIKIAKSHGAKLVKVATSDKADRDFDKMVGFMGFDVVLKVAGREL